MQAVREGQPPPYYSNNPEECAEPPYPSQGAQYPPQGAEYPPQEANQYAAAGANPYAAAGVNPYPPSNPEAVLDQ